MVQWQRSSKYGLSKTELGSFMAESGPSNGGSSLNRAKSGPLEAEPGPTSPNRTQWLYQVLGHSVTKSGPCKFLMGPFESKMGFQNTKSGPLKANAGQIGLFEFILSAYKPELGASKPKLGASEPKLGASKTKLGPSQTKLGPSKTFFSISYFIYILTRPFFFLLILHLYFNIARCTKIVSHFTLCTLPLSVYDLELCSIMHITCLFSIWAPSRLNWVPLKTKLGPSKTKLGPSKTELGPSKNKLSTYQGKQGSFVVV